MLKNSIISIMIGAALFAGLHFFIKITWITEASIDILLGTIIDFFLFSLLLNFWNIQDEKKWQRNLDNHLDKIESLIKKTLSNVKENDRK